MNPGADTDIAIHAESGPYMWNYVNYSAIK